MSNKAKLFTIIIVVVVLIYAFFAFDIPYRNPDDANTPTAKIVISSPVSGARIASPVSLVGKAIGTWFFEASFPIEVLDAAGIVIGQGHAEAQGNWMTEDFVPWTASVSFASGSSTSGFIRFEKDNPSGDPARDEHVDVPVSF